MSWIGRKSKRSKIATGSHTSGSRFALAGRRCAAHRLVAVDSSRNASVGHGTKRSCARCLVPRDGRNLVPRRRPNRASAVGRDFLSAATAVSDPRARCDNCWLARGHGTGKYPMSGILAALRDGGLDSLVQRAGGLDVEHDWPHDLFIGRAATTRYHPPHSRAAVVRDTGSREHHAWIGSARECLQRLTDNSITYINFDGATQSVGRYDAVLEIDTNGAWNWQGPRQVTDSSSTGRQWTREHNLAAVPRVPRGTARTLLPQRKWQM